MNAEHRYRCHQCYAVIDFEEIAHIDMYFDLCWLQCEVCEAAFGPTCGVDRKANPHPHGYFTCPLRPPLVAEETSNVTQLRARH